MEVQRVMKNVTQSNLSAFHVTSGQKTSVMGGISRIIATTDLTDKARDHFMRVKPTDEESFRRNCIYRKIRYYTTNIRTTDFGADSFWITWDDRFTTVRLYIDYPKLLKDRRSLALIKETILAHVDCEVMISSNFAGIVDIKCDPETTVFREIHDILEISIGIDGILDYDDGIVSGSNVAALMATGYVDGSNLWSSHVTQIYDEFGVEAARSVLESVIGGVLADYATHSGEPTAFNKYAMKLIDKGLLLSMAFERPAADLKSVGRSTNGIVDMSKSVQSQIMIANQVPIVGSNSSLFDLVRPKQ